MNLLSRRTAIVVFLVFAFSYFLSTVIRAITATLSPVLTEEFALNARDLGLLAGGYFLGFAVTQLPLGRWLDWHGPRRVILCFLGVAVLGCLAFSQATSFGGLLSARILCGVGVSACLMAPLTGYRRWFSLPIQLRANSWMLMTGSLGLVASTLPVQWLVPVVGWRMLFIGFALLVLLAMTMIAWVVPGWKTRAGHVHVDTPSIPGLDGNGYREVWRSSYFRRMASIGFFNYGGLLAIQTLWATPWMIQVSGYSAAQAATGMFWINLSMLATFCLWGLVNPWLLRKGWDAERLILRALPLSFVLLAFNIGFGHAWSEVSGVLLALYCMSCTVVALAQPAVGLAFPAELAGRALSAYNLVIFVGVFSMQWGLGLLIDGLGALGWSKLMAYQGAMTLFLSFCMLSYVNFLLMKNQNQRVKTHE
jgi:MFS family permease